MAKPDLTMSLDDISAAFGFNDSAPRESACFGTVASVNADGSYQVRLNSSGTTTRTIACCDAAAGDRVLVLIMRTGRCAAIGRVRTN